MSDERFSDLHFCQSLYTLQRGLPAIAGLLIIIIIIIDYYYYRHHHHHHHHHVIKIVLISMTLSRKRYRGTLHRVMKFCFV